MATSKHTGGRLNVRVSGQEKQQLEMAWKRTTCHSLSEYMRAILFNRHVVYTTRNRSIDAVVVEMAALRKELNAAGRNINQAVKVLHTGKTQKETDYGRDLLARHLVAFTATQNRLQEQIANIAQQWLQTSG